MTVRATIFITKDVSDNDKAKDFYLLVDTCLHSGEHLVPEPENVPNPFHISMHITECHPPQEIPS